MMTLQAIFALLFGLLLGSFLNVCISRLPRHESIVRPPSHCPRCHARIAAYDNIPLLSFALLRGRCRHCHQRIAWRYPFVEAATAGLTLACILSDGWGLDGIAATVFCAFLITLAVCDAETLRLPDSLTLPMLALGLFYRAGDGFYQDLHRGVASAWHTALALGLRASISAVTAALVLLLLRWLYWLLRRHQGMGLGDVKLAAAIAAWLGLRQMAVVVFLAAVTGALSGMLVLAVRGRTRVTAAAPLAVPFGTFLCTAAIYCAFFGRATLLWYLHFFP